MEYHGSVGSFQANMAESNPFRYRGYYYDRETGFYFLKSRYYDPKIGRFISADGQLNNGLLGSNQYTYCENNPVMYIDPLGTIHWGGVLTGIVLVGSAIAILATFGTAGFLIAGAVAVTGIIMIGAAIEESAMVVDTSISVSDANGQYVKAGCSLVIDFSDDGGAYFYSHLGLGSGKSDGLSYSVGKVDNFNVPEDYSRGFWDINVGNKIGIDHCFGPDVAYEDAVKATSITFSNGVSYGGGYDWYSNPIVILKWD